jgi:DNA repair exonuclease SbcCD ATPase subunit
VKNSIEEDMKSINKGLYELEDSYELHQARWAKRIFENIKEKLDHILSEYKRVLKENEEWDRKFCNLQNLYFKLQDELESKRKEYQETYKDVREELKELRKENEELHKETERMKSLDIYKLVEDWETGQLISIQRVKDKIEEIQIEYNKLDKEVDEYINDANKELSKYYENKEKIGEMQTLSWCIDNLQELLKKED